MDSLRDEIRAILREEIAALTAASSVPETPTVETEKIRSGADLTRFAQEILQRATDAHFADRLASGNLSFELAQSEPNRMPLGTGPGKPAADVLTKSLITERDIAAMALTRLVRIGRTSRLTPLARDEARRRGIRIERSES